MRCGLVQSATQARNRQRNEKYRLSIDRMEKDYRIGLEGTW